jgi:hypothetical protein
VSAGLGAGEAETILEDVKSSTKSLLKGRVTGRKDTQKLGGEVALHTQQTRLFKA